LKNKDGQPGNPIHSEVVVKPRGRYWTGNQNYSCFKKRVKYIKLLLYIMIYLLCNANEAFPLIPSIRCCTDSEQSWKAS